MLSCHTLSAPHSSQAAPHGFTFPSHVYVTTAPHLHTVHSWLIISVDKGSPRHLINPKSVCTQPVASPERIFLRSLVGPKWYLLYHLSEPHGFIAGSHQLSVNACRLTISPTYTPYSVVSAFSCWSLAALLSASFQQLMVLHQAPVDFWYSTTCQHHMVL